MTPPFDLLPFQRDFLSGAFTEGVDTAALSIPRGNGKSSLMALLARRSMCPGDDVYSPGAENHLVSGSIEQCRRTTFGLLREYIGQADTFRVAEQVNAAHVTRKACNTKVSVLGSNARYAQGIVRAHIILCDEPGAWETLGGAAMNTAIQTALGKPESELRVIYVGTLAPATAGWWHDLVARGSHDSTYVMSLVGDSDRWAEDEEIARCNPLMWKYKRSRKKLLLERDEARDDPAKHAEFLSFRLNLPTADSTTKLIPVDDWKRTLARPVPPRKGTPVVGIDLGAERSLSAAVAIYPNGRAESIAMTPGLPSIDAQEQRDQVPPGTYRELVSRGVLTPDEGHRKSDATLFSRMVFDRWKPRVVLADVARFSELQDSGIPVRLVKRPNSWMAAGEDVRAVRKVAADGPLAVADDGSREILEMSIRVTTVKDDGRGNVRIVKLTRSHRDRDDPAAALAVAAGAFVRSGPVRAFRSRKFT